MIKLVLTDMDDTLIPAGHDGASDYAIEGIHAMQAAGLHFGPVSGRQPSAMGWMFRNCVECFSTGAFCNGQVMFVDGQAVASRATDNAALMRLADYLEQETDDTYLKVYSLGDDFWDNDAYCVTSDPERVRRAMESGATRGSRAKRPRAVLLSMTHRCSRRISGVPVRVRSSRSYVSALPPRCRSSRSCFPTIVCACSTSFQQVGTRVAPRWSLRALWT